MRKLELVLVIAMFAVGCSDSERSGEKGVLSFRLSLGGCASVPLSEAALAPGGEVDLEVGDDERRTSLTAATDAAEVVVIANAEAIALKCVDTDCDRTQGTVTLEALKPGEARLTFENGDTLVDAVTVQVRDPVRLVIVDEDDDSEDLRTAAGTPIELTARLLDADSNTIVATRPFTWHVEGSALGSTTSNSAHVSLAALAEGTSTVTVTFRELTATTRIEVER